MTAVCIWCGRSFGRRPSKVGPVNYCSRRCAGHARRRQVLLRCAKCGEQFFRAASSLRHRPPFYCSTRCAALCRGRKGPIAAVGELRPLPSIEDAARRYVTAVEAVDGADIGAMLAAECERDAALHDLFIACARPCKCDPPDTCPSYQRSSDDLG